MGMKALRLLLFLVTISHRIVASRFSPIVGILSEPFHNAENKTEFMIAASYTKWLELGGMRAVAIPYDLSSDHEIDALFQFVNGVLFPGGAGSHLPYVATRLWKLANDANKNSNVFFPLWGTCLGFEYLAMLASEDVEILQGGYDAENLSLPLDLQSSSSVSRLYQGLPPQLLSNNITMNNHMFGISPNPIDGASYQKLNHWFEFTTTNYDRNGKPFVSTMESKLGGVYPYYGVQFHPEKNAFEYGSLSGKGWAYESINHNPEAIYFSAHLAHFFGNLTRTNLSIRKQQGIYHKEYPWVYTYEHRYGFKFQEFFVIPSATELIPFLSVPV